MTGPSGKAVGSRTKKARAALAEARQRAREIPVFREAAEVFILRVPGGNLFGWEIRQFGGLVRDRGQEGFSTPAEARAVGERALTAWRSATSDEGTP